MVTKCIVKECVNRINEGEFIGDLCSPCYEFIAEGKGLYSQAYRNAMGLAVRPSGVITKADADGYWNESREIVSKLGLDKRLTDREILIIAQAVGITWSIMNERAKG